MVQYSFFKSRKHFWELKQMKRCAKQSIFIRRKARKWLRTHVANLCVCTSQDHNFHLKFCSSCRQIRYRITPEA
jgi:hypothetical protein